MTVATATTNRAQEAGNGSKTAFDFSFRIFLSSELEVFKVTTSTNAQSLQTLGVDYTVAINGVDNTLTTPGGTVTYTVAPTASEQSLIISDFTLDQQTDIPTASNFPEVAIEDALDKLTLIAIQLNEEVGRSAKVPSAVSLPDLELPVPTANKALLWNATADALINSTDDFENSASAAAASAAAAATSASNASTSETNAAASASAAATSASEAQAAVGGVRISADDTTPANLEAKLLVGTGLDLSTQNPGANETRTIDLDHSEFTDTTIAATDEIAYVDVSDSNNMKKDTVQGILDLVNIQNASDTTAGIIEIATVAEIETGTSTTLAVTPGRQQKHLSAVKFWLRWTYTAGTPSAVNSFNVSSLTDTAAGQIGINVDVDFTEVMSVVGTSDVTDRIVTIVPTSLGVADVKITIRENGLFNDANGSALACGDQ